MNLFEISDSNYNTTKKLQEKYQNHGNLLLAMVETCILTKNTPEDLIYQFARQKIEESGGPKTRQDFQLLNSTRRQSLLK